MRRVQKSAGSAARAASSISARRSSQNAASCLLLAILSASGPTRSVDLFAEDVGVAGVPAGLGKHVDQDVEQFHLGVRPPLHVAGCI